MKEFLRILIVLVACLGTSGCSGILCLWDGGDVDECFPQGLSSQTLVFDGPDEEIGPVSDNTFKSLTRGRAVSTRTDGSFVVVYFGQGGYQGGTGIFGQRYDDEGAEDGTEFRVSSDNQAYPPRTSTPAVDHLANGGFVVSWIGSPESAQGGYVFQPMSRVYDALGDPIGTEIDPQVVIAPQDNYISTAYPRQPLDVAAGESGFVVVWEGTPAYNTPTSIFGHRFGTDGTPLGTEFKVNSYTQGRHLDPSIGMAADGSFVVAWTSAGTYTYTGYEPGRDGAYAGVLGQRFNANGTPDGTEFQVNTFTTYSEDQSDIAVAANGSFVVVWRTQYGDEGYTPGIGPRLSDSITMRRYDAEGDPIDEDEIHINSYTTGGQVQPSIAMANDGSFVVAWRSAPGYNEPEMRDDEEGGLFARCFDSNGDGSPVEFHLNSYTPGLQNNVSLSTNGNGAFVATWTNQTEFFGAQTGHMRRFTASDCETVPTVLELTKSDNDSFWAAGELLTYTLSITNNSGVATNVTLNETVPNRATFSAADSEDGWSCSGGGAAREPCTYVVSNLAAGATANVDFAVTVDEGLPGLWWMYNQASATVELPAAPASDYEVTERAICDTGLFDPAVCSFACFIVPEFCPGASSLSLGRLAANVIRDDIGYPELELRDGLLASTRGGTRATDLYYEQSANAVAAAMSDSNVATTAMAAGREWAQIFTSLAQGTGDSFMVTQEAVDVTTAFTDALRAAAGPELAAVMDRELPRLDIPSWVGMPVSDIIDEANNLTCEGFEDQLFCAEINGDCAITATDALAVLRIAVGTLESVPEADVDGSGAVTATDALQALTIAVGVNPPTDACNGS